LCFDDLASGYRTRGWATRAAGYRAAISCFDPTRTWPGNFAVTHKTLPFGDVLECLLDLREDL
jgi:hypothetical protein